MAPKRGGRALFLDRDGVLNRRLVEDYVRTPRDFEWLPGVLDALQILRPLFTRVVVVTNQQGIGKGFMSERDLAEVHAKLLADADAVGVEIDAVFHCPALAADGDPCRKPAPGMGLRAQAEFPEIDFAESIMVGDSPSDVGFGESLGMRTVGITTSYADIGAAQHFASLLEFAQDYVRTLP